MAKIRKTIVTPDNAPISDGDLQETAEVYQKHVNLGLSGIQGLMDTFGYTRRTAGRHVALARKAGLLPETKASLNAQQRVLERGTAYAPKTAPKAVKTTTKPAATPKAATPKAEPKATTKNGTEYARERRAKRRAERQAHVASILSEEVGNGQTATKSVVDTPEFKIRWEEPPPINRSNNGREIDDKMTWMERLEPIKAARKEHPKEWAVIRTFKKNGRHWTAARNLTYGLLKIPAGRWEFVARTNAAGEHNVYARYLGPDYRRKNAR